MTYNFKDYEAVFNAIEDDYVFSDEKDEDDFFVLVDENREIDENFKPKKGLIAEMESKGYIEAIEKETKREYVNFRGKKRPLSLISIYKITDQGKVLINKN